MTQVSIGKKTNPRAPRAIIILSAAFVLMLWSGLFYDSLRNEEVAIEQSRKDVSNLALAYREHISRTVSAIDELLIAVVAEHTRYPDEFRVPEWIEGLPILREMAVQFALAGPDGIARFSNLGLSGQVDLSDRPHFRHHLDPAGVQPFISVPVLGRVSQKWSIQFTRRLTRNDGSFDGIVIISVDPSYLSKFFDSLNLGKNGTALLAGQDGIVRARGALNNRELGQDIRPSSLFENLRRAANGTFVATSPIDGTQRVMGYASVTDYPLVVALGFSTNDILAGSHRQKVTYAAVGGLGAIFVVAFAFLLARDSNRRRQRELETNTNERIQEQKLQLDTALNNMSQGLNLLDASGRLVVCNERYLQMYGVSAEIVKPGCTIREMVEARFASGSFIADDPQRYAAELLQAMRRRKGTNTIHKLPDGRSIAISSQPTPNDGGWVVTHQDITERQQFLEARELSEKIVSEQKVQLDAALNNMNHGLCMFDCDGRIVLFNQRYVEMMGETAEFLQGRSLLDLCKHRQKTGAFLGDPDEFFSRVMDSARAGTMAAKEMVRADGIVLRVVDQPMKGGGWVATFEDVTEQRRAEQDRDRNRVFLDLIIDHVPSAIWVKGATDRKYVLVNRAAENFWGVSRQAMIGKTARDVFSEQEARTLEAREADLLRAGEPQFDEREVLAPSGRMRSIFSRRLTISDEKNAPQYLLAVVDDVTERKAAEAKIALLAHYDPLTNLPNRTLFREQLEKELSFVRRGAKLAVLYLDLDHFKNINDTLGHPCGDELLRSVAQRLRGCLRESDLIARLGGDEFAIVQTQLQDPTEAAVLAQRLREAVTGAAYDLLGHQTTTDLSIGIALAPGDGTEMDELVKHADLALYGAKAEGRANYRYYEPEMNARMKQRRGLEVDLRSALANAEFELHYQPLVNLQTGAVTGCEALLRWNHPQRGKIPPLEFIPVAEETGLINAIGDWVLRSACVEAMNWPDHVTIAVNVSPIQFRNSALALNVISALAASGLPARRLELEVTESVLMQNNDATLATLHQIRNLGVRISMDDFGTGYSSLSYLRSFPFDKIKIDRSFIGDLSKGDDAVAIVQAILNLATSLKMTTTAEGVETADQQRLLKATGCNEMQGYLFSRPRPAAEIAELLYAAVRPPMVA